MCGFFSFAHQSYVVSSIDTKYFCNNVFSVGNEIERNVASSDNNREIADTKTRYD